MKRAISLILVLVICIGLCSTLSGCGKKLTLDNYTDYMEVYGGLTYGEVFEGDEIWFGKRNPSSGDKQILNDFFTSLRGYVSTDNVAPNFNYENVKITVKYTGTVFIVDKNSGTANEATATEYPFEFQGTFSLTLAGDPKDDGTPFDLQLPENMVAICDSHYLHGQDFQIKYEAEIISISGAVKPA